MAGSFQSIFKRRDKAALDVPKGEKPLMRALEPRVLLDAAAVETALDVAGRAAHSQLADDYIANSRMTESMSSIPGRDTFDFAPPTAPDLGADEPIAGEAFVTEGDRLNGDRSNEIVFVDAGVDNKDELIASLEPGVTVHILEAGSDGVQQIADILAGSSDYGAIHIFSHGVAGALQLGNAELNAGSINSTHAAALRTIGAALSETGDILIYGCDFGQGEKGRVAAGLLAAATGADVAASDDLTGSESLAGDWDLEVQTGQIDRQSFSAPNWEGILAGYTFTANGAPEIGHRDNGIVGTAGTTATWANAVEFDNGTPTPDLYDIRATIVGLTANTSATFETVDSDGTGMDDFRVVMTNIGAVDPSNPAPGALEPGSVTIRWEIFEAGTTTPANPDIINFTLADLTGNAGFADSEESITLESDNVTQYTVQAGTDLDVSAGFSNLFVSGTTQATDERSQIAVELVDSNRFVITYTSRTLVTDFDMVGNDGSTTFSSPVVQDAQFIDLNGISDGGQDYTAFYINGSAFGSPEDVPLSLVDLDFTVFDMDNTELAGATITLNNAYAGDQINYDEDLLNTLGIFATFTVIPGSGGGPDTHVLQLDGLARISNYLTALQSITYSNPLPDTAPPPQPTINRINARIVDIAITDGVQSSSATTTIAFTTAGDAPIAGNNVYVAPEDTDIVTDYDTGLIGDDRDRNTSDLDVVSVTDSQGVALIEDPTDSNFLINPSDPVTGESLLTSGANFRVDKRDGSFVYTPAEFYNGNEVFAYVVTDGTFNTQGFATIDIQPVANDVTLDIVKPDPVTDPGTPEDQPSSSISFDATSPDAKETQVFMALGVPSGVILTDGLNSFRADDDLQDIDITNWDRTQLRVLPVQNSDREISIEFLVTNYEVDDSFTEASEIVTFKVNAVADAPTLIVNDARGGIDEDVNLSTIILPELFDDDGSEDITDITISNIPAGAQILVDNTPRTITGGVVVLSRLDLPTLVFRPPQTGQIIEYTMLVSATATEVNPNGDVLLASATTSGVVLSVTLDDQTEPVIAVDDTGVTFAGQAVTMDVLANDSIPDGAPIITMINDQPIDTPAGSEVTLPGGEGTVYLTPFGELRFEAAPLFSGEVQFTYTVQDVDQDEDTAIVTVKVQPRWALSGDTTVNEDGGGTANFQISIDGAVQQGQSISTDIVLQDGTANAADHEALITAVARAIAGPPAQPDFSFTGATLTYTAPDANYVSTYSPASGDFIDIQLTGTPLLLGDDGIQAAAIGFDFNVYGQQFDTAYVSANGYLTFGLPASSATNQSLDGNALGGRPIIAPYWDDLDTSTGSVLTQTITNAEGEQFFVVQWQNVTNKNGGGQGTFQVVMSRSSGEIYYNYQDVDFGNAGDNGAQATIGIQSSTGVVDEFAHNQAGAVVSGSSIRFDRGLTLNPVLNIGVNIVDDSQFEITETFALKLQNAVGSAIGTDLVEVTIDVSDNGTPAAVDDTGTVSETGILITNLINPNNAVTGEAGEDSDPEGHTLSLSRVNGVLIGSTTTVVPLSGGSSLIVEPNGQITYQANDKFDYLTVGESAFDTFTYFVKDQYGAVSATPATVTIEVLGVNQAPDVDFDTSVTAISRTVSLEYLPTETVMPLLTADAGVLDPDDTTVASVSLSLSGFVQPLTELVHIGGLGIVHGSSAGTNTVTINSTLYRVAYDGANIITITLDAGGEMTLLQAGEVIQSLGYENSSADDTPGIRSIAIVVNDGADSGVASTINVDVVGNNTAPIAGDDGVPTPYQVIEDGSIEIDISELMLNDMDMDVGDVISFDDAQDGPNGTASYDPVTQRVTFTPDPDFTGPTSFTYTIRDIKGTIGTGTVFVNVLPVNDAPRVDLNGGLGGLDYAFTYDENDPLTPIVSSIATVIDVDNALMTSMDVVLTNGQVGDRLRVGLVPGSIIVNVSPAQGATGLTSAGPITIRFTGGATPAEYQTALHAISFENITDTPDETTRVIEVVSSDGVLSSVLATTTITVDAQNDAPDANDDTGFQLDEDVFIAIPPSALLANDSDAENNPLTIISVQDPFPGGTVGFNGPGDVVFIPPPDYFGPASFTYTVSDGNGGESIATVNLLVRSVNDATIIDLDTNTPGLNFSTGYIENDPATPIVDASFFISDVDDTQMEGATIFLTNGRASDVLELTVTSPDISVSILPAVPIAVDGPILVQLTGTASIAEYTNVIRGITFEARTEAPNVTPRILTVTMDDGTDQSNVATTTISVTAVNDAPTAVDDNTIVFDEDTSRIITQAELLGNDFDPDGEPITLVSVQDAMNGTVVLNGNGTITFTPVSNYFGPASFTYTVEDAANAASTATVNMTISSVNDLPQVDLDTNTGGRNFSTTYNEDDALGVALIDASGIFTDVDDTDFEGAVITLTDGQIGDSLFIGALPPAISATISPVGPLLAGQTVTVTLSGTASVSDYMDAVAAIRFASDSQAPTAVSATRTIEISVQDGDGSSNVANTTISVIASNDDPIANAETFNTDEDTVLQLATSAVTFNDQDPDGDSFSVQSVGSATNGTVALVGGQIRFTPDLNFSGVGSFEYTIVDGNGGSATTLVTVNVNPVNDAPTADLNTANGASTSYSTSFTEGDAPVAIAGPDTGFNDIDNSQLEGMTVTLTNGQIGDVLVVGALPPGISVSGLVPPALTAPGTYVVSLTGSASFADYEAALQAISYDSQTNDPSGVNRTIAITVTDGTLSSAPVTSTIAVTPVNDAPVAGPDGVFTFDEDTLFTIFPAGLLANDTDGENDALRLTGVSNPTNGTVIFSNGRVTFTPDPDYFGPASFEYTVTDEVDVSTGVVTLDIVPVNDAPILDLDGNVAGTGYAVTFIEDDGAVAIVEPSMTVSDVDDTELAGASVFLANGQVGDFLSVGALPGGITATVVPSGPLTATGTITVELVGAASFADYATALEAVTYNTASNAPNTINRSVFVTITDGEVNSASSQTTITVIGVNDAPTVVDDGPFILDEDTPFTAAAVGFLLNDSDFEGDALSVIDVHTPVNGSVALSPAGIVTFTPDANFNGLASFQYDVRDAAGGVSTGTVSIQYTSVNDLATVDLDGNTPGNGFVATYTENDPAVVLSDPSLIIDDVDSPDLAGATFFLSDGRVGDILEVGALPAGITASVVPATALTIDSTITVTLTGVATQADYMAALQVVTFRSTSENPDTSARNITVTVNDGEADSAPANVIVAVTAVNDAPTAVADGPFSVDEDTVLELPVASLTANDTDPEGDPLTLVSVQDAVNGTVVLGGDGIVRFTPTATYSGPASFTYTVRDDAGLTSTQTVSINVIAVNDAPIIDLNGATAGVNFSTSYDENAAGVQIVDPDVTLFDEDHLTLVDARVILTNGKAGDILEIGLLPGTMSATVVPGAGLSSDGVITIVLSGNAPLADYEAALEAITYRSTSENPSTEPRIIEIDASDGIDRSAVVTSTINVNSINDAPIAVDDGVPGPLLVQEDAVYPFNPVAANDRDVEGDVLFIAAIDGTPVVPGQVVSLGATGTVELGSDGQTLTFRPALNSYGPVSFDYTLSDGDLTDTASINIEVVPVNDAPLAVDDGPVILVEDTNVTFDPITGSDSDVEGDPLSIVSIDGQAIAPFGTVITADGRIDLAPDGRSLVFTPAPNFAGQTIVVYGVSDGQDVSTAQITFDVTPVDDPLTIISSPSPMTFADGEVINLPLAPYVDDPDGDALLFTQTGLPAGLSLHASTGIVSGVIASDASQSGPYTVVVEVTDGIASTESFSFVINVVNPAPVAQPNVVSVLEEGSAFNLNVGAQFVDPDGDALTLNVAGLPAWASFDSSTGLISGTVPADAEIFGPQLLTITADDGQGGVATSFLTLDPRNAVPVALGSIGNLSLAEGAAVDIGLGGLFRDGGADSDELTISVFGLPAGVAYDAQSNRITGVIADGASAAGTYYVAVIAADAQGAYKSLSFEVAVNASATFADAPAPRITRVGFEDLVDTEVEIPGEDEDEKFDTVRSRVELQDDDMADANGADIVLGVGSTVDRIADLGSIGSLFRTGGVVGSAVDGIDPLKGVEPAGSDGGLPEDVADLGDVSQSTDWLTDSGRAGNGDWDVSGTWGYKSLLDGVSDRERTGRDDRLSKFSLFASNRQGVIFIEFINALDVLRDGQVVKTSYSQADGGPLPEWMKVVRDGFLKVEPQVGQEQFVIKVTVTLANGNELSKLVRVDTDTGRVTDLRPGEKFAPLMAKEKPGDAKSKPGADEGKPEKTALRDGPESRVLKGDRVRVGTRS